MALNEPLAEHRLNCLTNIGHYILPTDERDLLFCYRGTLAVSSINVPLNTLLKLMEICDYPLISFIFT